MNLNYNHPEAKADNKCECKEVKKYDNKDCYKCEDEHKYAHCYPKSPCPYPILFECTQGGSYVAPTIAAGSPFNKVSLGCLTIDTSCLKSPVVKFDFTSIISYRNVTADTPVTLEFQLYKLCDGGYPICCGTWNYTANLDVDGEQLTTSFCFSHCECNSCPGCCTYTVYLTNVINADNDNLYVNNTMLSAIAKSSR